MRRFHRDCYSSPHSWTARRRPTLSVHPRTLSAHPRPRDALPTSLTDHHNTIPAPLADCLTLSRKRPVVHGTIVPTCLLPSAAGLRPTHGPRFVRTHTLPTPRQSCRVLWGADLPRGVQPPCTRGTRSLCGALLQRVAPRLLLPHAARPLPRKPQPFTPPPLVPPRRPRTVCQHPSPSRLPGAHARSPARLSHRHTRHLRTYGNSLRFPRPVSFTDLVPGADLTPTYPLLYTSQLDATDNHPTSTPDTGRYTPRHIPWGLQLPLRHTPTGRSIMHADSPRRNGPLTRRPTPHRGSNCACSRMRLSSESFRARPPHPGSGFPYRSTRCDSLGL